MIVNDMRFFDSGSASAQNDTVCCHTSRKESYHS